MEPEIVTLDAFTVMGVLESFPSSDPAFYDTMWLVRFPQYEERVRPFSPDRAYYGVYYHDPDGRPIHYLAGMKVENATEIPEGLVVRPVSAARYVAIQAPVKGIAAAAEYLFGEWLPASPYEYAAPLCDLEIYPPETENPDSPVWVYVPIREKVAT